MALAGKYVTIFMDDSGGTARNITSDVMNIDGLALAYDEIDISTYGSAGHSYLAGMSDSTLTLEMQFDPTATTGSHTVFSGIAGSNTAGTLTVQIGQNATPTSGDPEFEGEFIVTNYTVTPVKDGLVTGTATLKVGPDASAPAWGTVA